MSFSPLYPALVASLLILPLAACGNSEAAACVAEVESVDICLTRAGAVSWCRDIDGTAYTEQRDEVSHCEDIGFEVQCPGNVVQNGTVSGEVEGTFEASLPYWVEAAEDCDAADGAEL